ncbi:hypothetical protein HGRIS_005799 [Hohenbuehelia grisea]|uniref:Uncharacterized protein n=1 Tax=Hohenbuehelia grisea TaxID=104357 RepID=A0ABR3JYZ7_9AGAR
MASIDNLHNEATTGAQNHHKVYPSEVVAPTRTDSIPQQASTQPGDGSHKHHDHHEQNQAGQPVNVVEVPGQKVPFKDQVIGYAQKTRGTLLGKPEVKEHGEKVLEGQVPAQKPTM